MAFSVKQAREIGDKLKVDWDKIPLEQFRRGLEVEMEHKDVTGGDPLKTGKIALAHIKERSDYYTQLKKIDPDLGAGEKGEKKEMPPEGVKPGASKPDDIPESIERLIDEGALFGNEPTDPNQLYARTAQMLAIGLHQDMPDDLDKAVDFIRNLLKTMYLKKRLVIYKAVQQMGRTNRAKGLLRNIQKEY